jgi:hypothetical protein
MAGPPWQPLNLDSVEAFVQCTVWLNSVMNIHELMGWKGLACPRDWTMNVFKVHTALSHQGKPQKVTTSWPLSLNYAKRCHLLWIMHRALSRGAAPEEGGTLAVSNEGLRERARGRGVGGYGQGCVQFDARRLSWGNNYEEGVFSVAKTAGDRSKWRLKVTFSFPNAPDKYLQSVGKILCYLKHGVPPEEDGPSTSTAPAVEERVYAMHICEHASCVNPNHMQWATKSQDIEGWRSLFGGPRPRLAFIAKMRSWGWL